ncbi:phytoene/squalene synthase family protein [Roseomonas elaeocarpi]|uniref:Phytoene/squalene synthase family protein n=1 Tax=Roseomonas elaeocarpi TaxID=907779 RepID=A0ABV6JXT3_9PROT
MGELSATGVLAQRSDPDRFRCTLFAPPNKREALWCLLAFNNELARAREVVSQPTLALIRLQWWRDMIAEVAAGRPARRHEVAEPLAALLRSGTLAAEDLLPLIDAREAEAEEIETRAGFDAYLRGTAGGLAVAMARVLDAPVATLPAVQEAGALYGLAGVMRSLPAQAAQERCLLPREMLPGEVFEPFSDEVAAVVRQLATEALPRVEAVRQQLRALPGGAVAAVLPLVLAARDLRRLSARGTPDWPPVPRGAGDRLAVSWAGLRGKL